MGVRVLLTERQLGIVLSVVYEYIKSGESVGSKTISHRYITNSSSATIRNEMSELEDMGFLKQTHTSSGRIPTTLGYRLYVDSMLSRVDSEKHCDRWIKNLCEHQKGIEGALESASDILSRMSNYVGIAALAPLEMMRFQKVDFVRISDKLVLLLVVLQGGLVHQKTINLPWDLSQDYLDDLSRRVNLFAGRPWSEVQGAFRNYIKQELVEYRFACKEALKELEHIILDPTMKVFTGSMSHMLNLPDFQDLSRIQALYEFIEQESSMAELVNSCIKKGINVVIGEENDSPAMKKSSIVAFSLEAEGQRAIVGVIGPERMDYERAVTALDRVLHILEPDSERKGAD